MVMQSQARKRIEMVEYRQRGATLVVALIMLMILTILGVASMNTTRLDERMAANSQEKLRAFQSAESGISDAYANLDSTQRSAPRTGGSRILGTGGTLNAGATYVSRYIGTNNPPVRPGLEGFGVTKFQAYYFDIQSQGYNQVTTGSSNNNIVPDGARNSALAFVSGGAYQIVPKQ